MHTHPRIVQCLALNMHILSLIELVPFLFDDITRYTIKDLVRVGKNAREKHCPTEPFSNTGFVSGCGLASLQDARLNCLVELWG